MSDETRPIADLIHTYAPDAEEQISPNVADNLAIASQLPDAASPEPAPTPVEPPDLSVCPACGRKLLSTRSILCNWCGSKIADIRYQQKAAAERAQADNAQRQAIEEDQRLVAQYGVWGKIKRTAKAHPPGSMLTPPKDDVK
jgi:hypothetical protein